MADKKERSNEEIEKILQEAWLTVPEDVKDDYLMVTVAIRKSDNRSTLVFSLGDDMVEEGVLGRVQGTLRGVADRIYSVKHTTRVVED